MKIMSMNEPVKKYMYELAKKNNIDLKYFCSPVISIDEQYLSSLAYAADEKNLESLKKLALASYEYHYDRTEINIARRIKERELRVIERENDPLYWLGVYFKAQQVLKNTLRAKYRYNGESSMVLDNMDKIEEIIKEMEVALQKIKSCSEYGRLFAINDIPKQISVQDQLIVPQTEKGKEVEEKYRDFCEKYGIDLKYISELTVFNNKGVPYTEKELRESASLPTQRSQYGWAGNTRLDNVKDSPKLLTWYHSFVSRRTALRRTIASYMDDHLSGELNEEQKKNLQSVLMDVEWAFALMTLSKHYQVGFQVSDGKEFEIVDYVSGTRVDVPEVAELNGDEVMLNLHQIVAELQQKLENNKRQLATVTSRREEIRAEQQKLEAENQALANEQLIIEQALAAIQGELESVSNLKR